jgi:NAD(P)-dependent dehydrogenase (short-subunit alcohol dehydrogenase family)
MPETSSTRVWLVTGCSSGLGAALARAVLERGERLVATARKVESLGHLQGVGSGELLPLALEVTDHAAIGRVVAATLERFGRIDVLVNNAGFGMVGAIEEVGDELVRKVYEANVFGLLAMTRAVLPVMRGQKSGHILMISSIGGLRSNPGSGIYCSTKFAVEGIGEALKGEVESFGIKVTNVEPGAFRTDFAGRSITMAPPIPAYADTVVGAWRERTSRVHGTQPGDPMKAAAAMIEVVEAKDPPLRLLLGPDALQRARDKLAQWLAEIDRYAAVTMATDVDPA